MTFERDADALAEIFGDSGQSVHLRRLFERVGGWIGLYRAGPEALVEVFGECVRPKIDALFRIVDRCLARPEFSEAVHCPEALLRALKPHLALDSVEGFWVVLLDARARVVGFEQVARGTLTTCLVHPREVFAPALRARAASIVLLHNHPSGDPEPSIEDGVLTERLVSVGQLLGIPVVDHVIVALGGMRSLISQRVA